MTSQEKILTLDALAAAVGKDRAALRRIVHCHGVFDLLHIGHIRHLTQARAMGDVLVVTLTADRFVDKGPHRPAFPEGYRAEALASLSCVDYVAVNPWPTAEETLRKLRPDVYVKGQEFKDTGSDMTGKAGREAQVVREVGARFAFTEDVVYSSTNLINRYLSSLPKEIEDYLGFFRKRYDLDEVLASVDRMGTMRVGVVGDAILDDYRYCEAIGKSSKDPVLALKSLSHDTFAGGALAVANHVAGFAGEVRLFTRLGCDGREGFVRERLRPNVTMHAAVQPGAPTLVKRRYLDGYSFNKLLEVYEMDDAELPPAEDEVFRQALSRGMEGCDVVIAADFGHGAISAATVGMLSERAPFLSVNTQANAGNRGFHTISRYPRADFGCLAEHELRLETRDLTGAVRPLVERAGRRLSAGMFAVTLGRAGCTVWSDDKFVEVPAFATKTVDRVGAGDAFLSIAALAAARKATPEIVGFLGNIAGALTVEVLGNQKPVDALSVKKFVTSLLK
ncbi:MAG: adenylyltransferase/cytidyltransferase family protein [Planctomycetes bacterium]|nr:adenylyltransferase/cytidyltransferase family protein [Planctomycetota bacterium]